MTRTFEEMCKARDPLYAAMQPIGDFLALKALDKFACSGVTPQWRRWYQLRRDQLTREIQYYVNGKRRNQRQPYYDAR
jgi:hypothetical protein